MASLAGHETWRPDLVRRAFGCLRQGGGVMDDELGSHIGCVGGVEGTSVCVCRRVSPGVVDGVGAGTIELGSVVDWLST